LQQILTSKFFEVVQQHTLGMMCNVMCCFVGSLTDLPAVKEF